MKLRLAYFGTPDFSARFLDKVISDEELPVDVVLVVTQPDKPVGRKKVLTASLVKEVAKKNGAKVVDKMFQASRFMLQEKIDLALLFAFGQIIPSGMLRVPRLGFWNVHPSLLPRYRGASPIAYTLLLGDRTTGVTLIQMDEKVDHGPIIAQEKYVISSTEKRPDLEVKLADLAFDLFKKTTSRLISTNSNQFQPVATHKQDHTLATYTRRLTKQDSFTPLSVLKKELQNNPLKESEIPLPIVDYHKKNRLNDWIINPRRSSELVYNFFRGIYPWPGVWTKVNFNTISQPPRKPPGLRRNVETGKPRGLTKRLKITDMSFDGDKLAIKRVQLEGKREVDFETFTCAYPNIF